MLSYLHMHVHHLTHMHILVLTVTHDISALMFPSLSLTSLLPLDLITSQFNKAQSCAPSENSFPIQVSTLTCKQLSLLCNLHFLFWRSTHLLSSRLLELLTLSLMMQTITTGSWTNATFPFPDLLWCWAPKASLQSYLSQLDANWHSPWRRPKAETPLTVCISILGFWGSGYFLKS